MTEIQRTNIAVCNEIIAQLGSPRPFNLKLDVGQTGALFNVMAATELTKAVGGFVDRMIMTLYQRKKNGTGIVLEINDSNADMLYHILSSYIAKHTPSKIDVFGLPVGVVKSLGEVP